MFSRSPRGGFSRLRSLQKHAGGSLLDLAFTPLSFPGLPHRDPRKDIRKRLSPDSRSGVRTIERGFRGCPSRPASDAFRHRHLRRVGRTLFGLPCGNPLPRARAARSPSFEGGFSKTTFVIGLSVVSSRHPTPVSRYLPPRTWGFSVGIAPSRAIPPALRRSSGTQGEVADSFFAA